MELWIFATIAAAFFQNLRFMLQKVLSATRLTPVGATWSRFVYSAPIILIALAITFGPFEVPVPKVGDRFWIAGLIGGYLPNSCNHLCCCPVQGAQFCSRYCAEENRNDPKCFSGLDHSKRTCGVGRIRIDPDWGFGCDRPVG